MENSLIVRGGKKLQGNVTLSGAKNVSLKVIIASLLLDEEVTLTNVPHIQDVIELLHLIKSLGGKAEFFEKNKVVIDGRGINKNKVDLLHASKIRVSFMFFAPLLHKFQECYVPNPGGCRIGARPIDRIIEGMKKLGILVEYNHESGYYFAKLDQKPKGHYRFEKPTHTGTELLTMLGMMGDEVIIDNAAQEPEIDQLILFLNKCGAKIVKDGKRIKVHKSGKLQVPGPFEIPADRNEAVTFASLALATGGDIFIGPIDPALLKSFIQKTKDIGASVDYLGKSMLRFSVTRPLKASSVETSPHPGFMTDWQPNWAVLMTQATGDSIIHERVFENRFSYVSELRKLGAEIDFIKIPVHHPSEYFFFNFDPSKKYNQAIRIYGSQKLHGGVLNIADLRAGATLAIAALAAVGESVITGASILDRGYDDFVGKIRILGGDITRI